MMRNTLILLFLSACSVPTSYVGEYEGAVVEAYTSCDGSVNFFDIFQMREITISQEGDYLELDALGCVWLYEMTSPERWDIVEGQSCVHPFNEGISLELEAYAGRIVDEGQDGRVDAYVYFNAHRVEDPSDPGYCREYQMEFHELSY
jgi:hypothetical protein